MRRQTARVWLKVWLVGPRIEVLVQKGKIRVILREPGKPATVEECDLEEFQIEQTMKGE